MNYTFLGGTPLSSRKSRDETDYGMCLLLPFSQLAKNQALVAQT